jgi:LPS sulfotransferase NodH
MADEITVIGKQTRSAGPSYLLVLKLSEQPDRGWVAAFDAAYEELNNPFKKIAHVEGDEIQVHIRDSDDLEQVASPVRAAIHRATRTSRSWFRR